MTVSNVTSFLILILFIANIIIQVASKIRNSVKSAIACFNLTLIGICDIVSYCFGGSSLYILIVGIVTIILGSLLMLLDILFKSYIE